MDHIIFATPGGSGGGGGFIGILLFTFSPDIRRDSQIIYHWVMPIHHCHNHINMVSILSIQYVEVKVEPLDLFVDVDDADKQVGVLDNEDVMDDKI